jgi:hypothetical protein
MHVTINQPAPRLGLVERAEFLLAVTVSVVAVAATIPLFFGDRGPPITLFPASTVAPSADDGPALRALISAACAPGGSHVVDLAPGTYLVGQEPGKLGGINITGCQGLTMRGSRHGTRLKMISRYMGVSEDYYLINIDGGSSGIELREMTLDGDRAGFSAAGALAEQVHLVRTYNVQRIDLRDLEMIESYGDCMKNINADDVGIIGVRCRGTNRDGINSHSGSEDVRLVGNSFSGVSDQHVATEGAGGNKRWTIAANSHGVHNGGFVYDFGSGASDFAVVGETWADGMLQSYGMERLVLVGNVAHNALAASASSLVLFKGKNVDVVATANALRQQATQSDGSCINVQYLDTARQPEGVVLSGNTCTHDSGVGILASTAKGLINVDANMIRSKAASGGIGVEVWGYGSSPAPAVRNVVVSDNSIDNEWRGVYLPAQYGTYDDVAVAGNVVTSAKTGSTGTWWEAYTSNSVPHASRCRVDGNVLGVVGTTINNLSVPGAPPAAPLGCWPRGTDAVP